MTRKQLVNRMSALTSYVHNPESYLAYHGMDEASIRVAVTNLEWDVKRYIFGEIKTSAEWCDEFKDVIIDPDGWDRKNFEHSFREELVDKQEYLKRLRMSTTQVTPELVKRMEEHV